MLFMLHGFGVEYFNLPGGVHVGWGCTWEGPGQDL